MSQGSQGEIENSKSRNIQSCDLSVVVGITLMNPFDYSRIIWIFNFEPLSVPLGDTHPIFLKMGCLH